MRRRPFSIVVLLSLMLLSAPAFAATITVNSTTDVQANDGVCTLREAIVAANANTVSGGAAGECAAGSAIAADVIQFSIAGGGVHIISPLTALPIIVSTNASPLTINGFTQAGASANTLVNGSDAVYTIRLDGNLQAASLGTSYALRMIGPAGTGGNTIRGLSITRFPDGGILLSSPGNTVAGNFIGVTETGTAGGNGAGGLGRGGVDIFPSDTDNDLASDTDASGNVVGGSNPADRNVISANSGGGILITGGTVPAFNADNATIS
jgi:CSLREA domain-containing protein